MTLSEYLAEKVGELVLGPDSFEGYIRDYCRENKMRVQVFDESKGMPRLAENYPAWIESGEMKK